MVSKTITVKAMTGWDEKSIADSLYDSLKKKEFISGIGTKPGKVKITVKVERVK